MKKHAPPDQQHPQGVHPSKPTPKQRSAGVITPPPAIDSVIQRALTNPASLSAADTAQLQRTMGNQAVGHLLRAASNQRSSDVPNVQTKLRVSPAGDHAEQEANAVTKQIVQMQTIASNVASYGHAKGVRDAFLQYRPQMSLIQHPVIQRDVMTSDELHESVGSASLKPETKMVIAEILDGLVRFYECFPQIREATLHGRNRDPVQNFEGSLREIRRVIGQIKQNVDQCLTTLPAGTPANNFGAKLSGAFRSKAKKEKVSQRESARDVLLHLKKQLEDEAGRQIVEFGLKILEEIAQSKAIHSDPAKQKLAGQYTDERLKMVKEKLGSGAVNTVSLLQDVETGKAFVFKTDKSEGMVALETAGSNIQEGAAAFSNRAVAMYRLDQLIGLNVIPETHFAEKGGYFGHIMAMATGDEVRKGTTLEVTDERKKETAANLTQEMKSGSLDAYLLLTKDEKIKEADEQGKFFQLRHGYFDIDYSDAQVQEGLTALQLIDLISGQVDRHPGNYFVDVDRKTGKVTVTAIDNDAAFGAQHKDLAQKMHRSHHLVGLPAVVSKLQAAKIWLISPQMIEDAIGDLLSVEEVEATQARLKQLQDHLYELSERGELVDDFTPESFMKMTQQNSYAGRENAYLQHLKENEGRLVFEFDPIPKSTKPTGKQALKQKLAKARKGKQWAGRRRVSTDEDIQI